jgi:hypothetical protein
MWKAINEPRDVHKLNRLKNREPLVTMGGETIRSFRTVAAVVCNLVR